MAKAKYDVGDILTFCVENRCYATAVIVKWHITSTYIEEVSLEQRTDYDLFIRPDEGNFRFVREVPECVFGNYKIVGHIDISGMPNDEVKTHLDCAVASEWCEWRIAYAVMAYWSLMKIHKSEEEDEYCCYDERDKLEKENRRLKEEIGMQIDKTFELNEKIGRIATNLRKIGFTSETIRNIIETDMV